MQLEAVFSTNNKKIGYVDKKEKVLHKRFKGSKHIFKKDNSLGLDYNIWKTVLLPQSYEIRALDEETNICYYTTAREYKINGHVKNFKGHALQIFLPLNYWKQKQL